MCIEVSVLCTTYNQAPYVAHMMEGIMRQETSFGYEVLVHDDASTDGTLEVLDGYKERLGNTLRLFTEERNRFAEYSSRGYFSSLLAPEARGTYVALCEGDDYWCDPHKLQRQYEYMQAHPQCTLCVHNALRVDSSTGQETDVMGLGDLTHDVDADQLIFAWHIPSAPPAASRFVRKSSLATYARSWVFDKPAGDFPLAVYLADCGYVHHEPFVGSVYRFGVSGSYSQTTQSAELMPLACAWTVCRLHALATRRCLAHMPRRCSIPLRAALWPGAMRH